MVENIRKHNFKLSTEAKYKALSEAAKEAIHIHKLVIELEVISTLNIPFAYHDDTIHKDLVDATTPLILDLDICCDNQGSIKLAKNPIFHAKTKHIEGKHHFFHKCVLAGEIKLQYI